MSKIITIKTREDSAGLEKIRPQNIIVGVKDDDSNKSLKNLDLGGVQSVNWSAAIGGFVNCKIETIMTEVQLEALEENVDLKVRVRVEHPCWFCSLKYKIDKFLKIAKIRKMDEFDKFKFGIDRENKNQTKE